MKHETVGIIAQARMSSTRLPGKVLLPFYQDQSILDIILSRLKRDLPEIPLLLATSEQPADDPIVACCERLGVSCFRGHETDVLDRFTSAAGNAGFQRIIRVCCDNPFLMTENIRSLIEFSQLHPEADYISYHDIDHTPAIKTHWGLFTEFVTLTALEGVKKNTGENLYHEHVTNYVYAHPERFNVQLLPAPEEVIARTDLRFTIDTPDDFEACRKLYQTLLERNRVFSLKDLILLVDESPDIKSKMQLGIQNFKK